MDLFRSPIIFHKSDKNDVIRRIAVVPAFSGAGASFISAQMALYERGPVNVIELGKPCFYLAYGMEKRFAGRPFVFFENELMGGGISKINNTEFGINWLVRPVGSSPMSLEALLKAVSFPPKGCTIYDFSSVDEDKILACLSEMDEIYLVIDPLPSSLITAAAFIEKILLLFPSANILINKMNSGVHKNELKKFLGRSKIKEIPFYPPEEIYRAEYNCCPPVLHKKHTL